MKKIKAIVIFLLGVAMYAVAGAQEVDYSPYKKFDFHGGDFSVVGKIGGKIYTYRGSAEGHYLDAYNDSMQLVATVVLDFFPNRIYETKFITYNDQIILLYQGLEGNKLIQYAALLDGNGRLKKGPIALDNVKTGIFGPIKNYFSYGVSDDKKRVVVYTTRTKGGELSFDGKWIDDQLNIVKRSHAVFNAVNGIETGEAIVANNGNLYFSAYTPVGSKAYSDQLWLLMLKNSDTKFSSIEFPLKDIYATSLYLKIDNIKNRIYAGGFYSDKRNGSYTGVLYGYYDLVSDSLQAHKVIPFDGKLLSESGSNNKKRAFDNFRVKQIIVKNDGGFVMLSEYFYYDVRTSYVPGFGYYSFYYSPYSSQEIREYHYNDIMALSYDGEGNRQWNSFVYKEQFSQEDAGLFSSYLLMNTGGMLGFLFNDFNEKNSQVQMALIDEDGKVQMHSFAIDGKSSPDWMPRSGKQVSAREVVVPCLRKREICFAKITF